MNKYDKGKLVACVDVTGTVEHIACVANKHVIVRACHGSNNVHFYADRRMPALPCRNIQQPDTSVLR